MVVEAMAVLMKPTDICNIQLVDENGRPIDLDGVSVSIDVS
jgi:hypothetical protein